MRRIKIACFFIFLFSCFLTLYAADQTIVLKLITINPSEENTQTSQVKAFLPKEIKQEDVISKGDLEIAYDDQEGSYYVYGEYELKPKEVLEKEVEIRDIWRINDAELDSLLKETVKVAEVLKNTEFSERIIFLKNSIESKLNQIIENQKIPPLNPAKHISDFRDNLKLLDAAKADLVLARSLFAQHKPLSGTAVWRLILIIIAFLGVLGAVFYVIWQNQVKTIAKEEETFINADKKEAASGESGIERHETGEEKKFDSEDIEKLLGGDK